MARFSFGIFDATTDTYLAGQEIEIASSLAGTVIASTSPPATGAIVISPAGVGLYYCDDLPSGNYWIYVNGVLQSELAGVPWDDGDVASHIVATTAHGSNGDILGEDDVDGTTIEFGTSLNIVALGVDTAQLASDAVTAPKIASDAVTTAKIIADAVTTVKVADLNVTGAKLAVAVAGDGLKKDASANLEIEVSTVAEELDLAINSAGQLKLLKSLSSTTYLSELKTLGQNLSIIDNRLRQLQEQSSAENGSYQSILFSQHSSYQTPNANIATPLVTVAELAYKTVYVGAHIKTPEMRQLVFYGNVNIDANYGMMKLSAGALSQESDQIVVTSPTSLAIYLDISSLPNWTLFDVLLQANVSNVADTMEVDGSTIIARAFTTSLAGETSYENPNPVE